MKATGSHSLRRATAVGFGLIVLLLVANTLVSQWNTQGLIEIEHQVAHTQKVLTTLEEVLARVTEAETGERGFLITGDADFLRSYQIAMVKTGETLERLRSLTADDPRQQARLETLGQRVQARFDELRRAIGAHQSEGFDAAKRSVSTNHGRQLMNEMRALVGEMQGQEREELAFRSAESRRSAHVTTVTDLVGSLLGIGMVGLAFFLFQRELAHRQRADDAMRRLAAIVESSDDAIVSKTLDGRIVSWNAGARRIYGYDAEEVIGRPIALLCPPECVDELHHHLELVRRGVHVEHFETTRMRKDGRRIDVSVSISPIRDGSGAVIGGCAIAREVTEHKRLQREVLEIAAREQQRLGQDLHDGTGQQLTGLAMMAERLAGELSDHSLPHADAAAKIVDGLEHALADVRALSKGLLPVEVDAEGLMAALGDLAAQTSELPGVTCSFDCDEPVCILDNQTATHLYRLCQESVTNALKHGPARNIVIALTGDQDLIRLTIADDGAGFAKDQRTRTGTGVRIMGYRAELIRAKLTISPGHPRGTLVTCTLPRPQASWNAASVSDSSEVRRLPERPEPNGQRALAPPDVVSTDAGR
ncbi:MAG: CHASE3 domain-containing protein [Planctomycetia bacterium]|nr:CHASE3 domain-containing protein [Planctomycetia bacterium]